MKRIIALALLLPTSVLAQEGSELSYNFFDMNYLDTSWDVGPTDIDGNGYAGRFSVQMRNHLFVNGKYASWEFDDVDGGSTSTSLGIGTNWNLGRRLSVFGVAGFRSIDLDVGAGNMGEEAGFVAGGARWQIANGFELRASADYADLEPARSGEVSVTIGGDIYLTDVVTLSLEVNEHDGETTTFMVGFRIYHDKESTNFRQRR